MKIWPNIFKTVLFIGVFFILPRSSIVYADLVTGLAGYWTLDDVSGAAPVDSSSNHNNGTLVSFPSDNSWRISGKISGAFMFNGTLVKIPNPANGVLDFGTNSFSYSVWAFPLLSSQQFGCPLWKGGEQNNSAGYSTCTNWGTGQALITARISDGTNGRSASFGSNSLLNTWSLLTVVVNRSDNTLKTYINGKYTGNSTDITGLGSVTSSQPLEIGMGSNWLPYNGAVDDVRVYNRALTDADIQALYILGSGTATLSVSLDPSSTGTGSMTGGTINCGSTCFQTVAVGKSITLTATSDAGSYLDSWGYNGCSGTGPCTFPMTADVKVALKFRNSSEESKIIAAASCSQQDVQAAIDGAKNGNTVTIPAGTCTWGVLYINKPITLSGAGASTIINISPSAPTYAAGAIQISAPAVVGGFTVNQPGLGTPTTAFSIGGANGWRITNITYNEPFTNGSGQGYFVYAESYGLIDSCTVNAGGGQNELIFARGPTDSWQTANSLGGADNLFIEDSTFNNSGYVTDCNSNARCVIRFNTITGLMKIDGHGKASNSPPRGVRDMEVYGNHWTNTTTFWAAMELRGGGGRVFANTADSQNSPAPFLFIEDYAAQAAWPNFNNVIQTPANYPIDDQIGVGVDPKVGGSEPMYLWSNKAGGAQWPIGFGYGVAATMQQIIGSDRDYFNEVSSFNGSSGIGVGTTAQMNAITPTKKGVGFWVTDQGTWNTKVAPGTSGVLYVWDGSKWCINYAPYPYPHPMRNSTISSSIIYGDVDSANGVTIYDASLIAQYSVGLITLTAGQKQAADVSGDNQVTIYDAALVAQYAVGLISKFPAQP